MLCRRCRRPGLLNDVAAQFARYAAGLDYYCLAPGLRQPDAGPHKSAPAASASAAKRTDVRARRLREHVIRDNHMYFVVTSGTPPGVPETIPANHLQVPKNAYGPRITR